MFKRKVVIGVVLAAAVLLAGTATAQWRGLGRTSGRVVDESGAPVADVAVNAELPGQGTTSVKTNEKGEWMLSGIARGEWVITLSKAGHVSVKLKLPVVEMAAPANVKTTMKKLG